MYTGRAPEGDLLFGGQTNIRASLAWEIYGSFIWEDEKPDVSSALRSRIDREIAHQAALNKELAAVKDLRVSKGARAVSDVVANKVKSGLYELGPVQCVHYQLPLIEWVYEWQLSRADTPVSLSQRRAG